MFKPNPYAEVQNALFKAGIGFVHFSPTQAQADTAKALFIRAATWDWGVHELEDRHSQGCLFVVAKIQGRGCNRVPVVFIED